MDLTPYFSMLYSGAPRTQEVNRTGVPAGKYLWSSCFQECRSGIITIERYLTFSWSLIWPLSPLALPWLVHFFALLPLYKDKTSLTFFADCPAMNWNALLNLRVHACWKR